MSPKNHDAEGEKTVASNRRARHDYEIIETYECGIVLTGDEVKSLRGGRAASTRPTLACATARCGWRGCTCRPTSRATSGAISRRGPASCCCTVVRSTHLDSKQMELRLSLVPLRVYFTHGIAKVEIALAKGKRQFEKRQSIAKRDAQREMEQAAARRR